MIILGYIPNWIDSSSSQSQEITLIDNYHDDNVPNKEICFNSKSNDYFIMDLTANYKICTHYGNLKINIRFINRYICQK